MSRLELNGVTLLMIETRENKLARLAIDSCLEHASFEEILVMTNDTTEYETLTFRSDIANLRFHPVPDWPDKVGWARAMWYDAPPLIRTEHVLCIQWDSWIWDPGMWRREFLKYDFIGAPWWYTDGKNVGNSGFAIKSARLMRYLYRYRDQFPCDTPLEDDLLCRKYRARLEDAGFTWAPDHVAMDFAFECVRPSLTSRHFGFHALFNWPFVLDRAKFIERLDIALESKYIREGTFLKAMVQSRPQLLEDEEIFEKLRNKLPSPVGVSPAAVL